MLLLERAGTGYADGYLTVPGGKLEDGEHVLAAAIREAREEVGVDVNPDDTRFVTVIHHRVPGREARIGFFFAASRWRGVPVNAEPDKCARVVWVDPADPPAHTFGYSVAGLAALGHGGGFVLDGWGVSSAQVAAGRSVLGRPG